MERSDYELLNGARGGDQDALERLLLRYQSKVYGFGLRMCRDPEDAKDVLQDTLLAMARGVGTFRGASSVSTWLYRIARSFCIRKRRRGRSVSAGSPLSNTHRGTDLLEIPSPGRGPEEALENREVEAMLAQAIGGLAPKYREVFVLRDLEGLSAPEVAEVLGTSIDTVKSRLHRARVSVRTTLAPALGISPKAPRRRTAQACPDVLTLFSRHLEGEISADVCAEMERHLARCTACREVCASLQRTLHICRTVPSPRVPEPVQRSVRTQLRKLLAESF